MIPTAHLVEQFKYTTEKMIEIAESVDREHWASQPGGVRNHPAWTLPHCAMGNGMLLGFLGKDGLCPEAWGENTGNGSMPSMDRTEYPPDADVVDVLRKQAAEITVEAIEAADLGAEMPHEGMREFWPTVGHAVAYMLVHHLADHKGQLLAWRRALKASLEHEK
ncbi:MAG: DinB family protein [Planctomycetota bacterium]